MGCCLLRTGGGGEVRRGRAWASRCGSRNARGQVKSWHCGVSVLGAFRSHRAGLRRWSAFTACLRQLSRRPRRAGRRAGTGSAVLCGWGSLFSVDECPTLLVVLVDLGELLCAPGLFAWRKSQIPPPDPAGRGEIGHALAGFPATLSDALKGKGPGGDEPVGMSV